MKPNKKLPSSLHVDQWFTKEEDLPPGPTNEVFICLVRDLNTKEEFYSMAMFLYDPVRNRIDFDEWRFICGARCFARESSDNIYNVIAWAKVKLEM